MRVLFLTPCGGSLPADWGVPLALTAGRGLKLPWQVVPGPSRQVSHQVGLRARRGGNSAFALFAGTPASYDDRPTGESRTQACT